MAHAGEVTGIKARDAWVFFCFLVVGIIPTMSLFLHMVLSTYGVVLTHLHPNALLALAIFQHLCKAYIEVRPLVALFCVLFEVHLDASGAISGSLIFHLRPHMVARLIAMPQRECDEWRAN
jgi:nitrate reductase NapE component